MLCRSVVVLQCHSVVVLVLQHCRNTKKSNYSAYFKTFRWVLYSLPPQNGDKPPDTIIYIMTPKLHISEAGDAWLHRITSGDINSRVPHMFIGIISPAEGVPKFGRKKRFFFFGVFS